MAFTCAHIGDVIHFSIAAFEAPSLAPQSFKEFDAYLDFTDLSHICFSFYS